MYSFSVVPRLVIRTFCWRSINILLLNFQHDNLNKKSCQFGMHVSFHINIHWFTVFYDYSFQIVYLHYFMCLSYIWLNCFWINTVYILYMYCISVSRNKIKRTSLFEILVLHFIFFCPLQSCLNYTPWVEGVLMF